MRFPFTKMQGCGNDFIVIDHRAGAPAGFHLTPELAAKLSHRQFGVGCDQILWLKAALDPGVARARVVILNADGSEAEMCGNGMRALAVFLGERRSGRDGRDQSFQVESRSGLVEMTLAGKYPSVRLGTPKVLNSREKISLSRPDSVGSGSNSRPSAPDSSSSHVRSDFLFARVDMGNPHAVFFLPNAAFGKFSELDLAGWGKLVEHHPAFPNRTNVEFVEIESRVKLHVRVWERGAGATLACGSGACAVVAAAEALGHTAPGAEVEVVLPGGSVFVKLEAGWESGQGRVHLAGPAEKVFTGEWL
ncbi:MAG: diaminopimelate epimerase [Cryobacterium sp.]|nr:diaminopimelate epimerase [Oligoflexia bacterium]